MKDIDIEQYALELRDMYAWDDFKALVVAREQAHTAALAAAVEEMRARCEGAVQAEFNRLLAQWGGGINMARSITTAIAALAPRGAAMPGKVSPRTGERCEHGHPIEACDGCWTKAEASRGAATPGPTCLCVRPEKPCEALCSTVERWAAACRAAHWFEDDTLKPWSAFVESHATDDGGEVDTWRRVARDAIYSLENDPEDAAFMAEYEASRGAATPCQQCGGDGYFKGPRLGDESCPACRGTGSRGAATGEGPNGDDVCAWACCGWPRKHHRPFGKYPCRDFCEPSAAVPKQETDNE